MGFTDYIKSINYLHIRSKIFRREVETAFFTHRAFKLPVIKRITKDDLAKFKSDYPFSFLNNEKENIFDSLLSCESKEDIIIEAENVINNRYNILNSGYIEFGEEINWHRDYNSKYTWENSLYWKNDFFNFPEGTDINYPWQLARFHQGLWLGKSYLITDDEKYLIKFLDLFKSFIAANSFCVGINWLSSSEIAIRLINILYSFSFFISSEKVDERIVNSLIEFILYHAIYIENNLEFSTNRNHKYLLDLLGLASAGLLLNNSTYGKKIFGFAAEGFEEEIRRQVYRDGVTYERSVPLHFLMLECLYLAKIILEKGRHETSDGFNFLLQKMFEAASVYLRNDDTVPLTGDSIPGRILSFKSSVNRFNYSYVMPVGSYLFNNNEWKINGKDFTAELIFLSGLKSFNIYTNLSPEKENIKSIALNEGNHYILRSEDIHLFISADEIRKKGNESIGHHDTFSFDLFYKDKNFIVDPGMYSQYADKGLYNKMKSERYHNTVIIDDKPFTDEEGFFSIKADITKPKIIEWLSNNEEDILTVQHYAYSRLIDPVICKRTFHFIKEKKIIKIKDEFFGGQKHKAELNFHFHPNVTVSEISDTGFLLVNNGIKIMLKLFTSSENFKKTIPDSDYSESYGILKSSKYISLIIKEKFPAFIITEIQLL